MQRLPAFSVFPNPSANNPPTSGQQTSAIYHRVRASAEQLRTGQYVPLRVVVNEQLRTIPVPSSNIKEISGNPFFFFDRLPYLLIASGDHYKLSPPPQTTSSLSGALGDNTPTSSVPLDKRVAEAFPTFIGHIMIPSGQGPMQTYAVPIFREQSGRYRIVDLASNTALDEVRFQHETGRFVLAGVPVPAVVMPSERMPNPAHQSLEARIRRSATIPTLSQAPISQSVDQNESSRVTPLRSLSQGDAIAPQAPRQRSSVPVARPAAQHTAPAALTRRRTSASPEEAAEEAPNAAGIETARPPKKKLRQGASVASSSTAAVRLLSTPQGRPPIYSVSRDGLYLGNQTATLIHLGVSDTCPLFAMNQAFGGFAVGLEMASKTMGQVQTHLAQRGTTLVEMSATQTLDANQALALADFNTQFDAIVARLESSGTVIVQTGTQEPVRDRSTGEFRDVVTQHFRTLVQMNGFVHMLDSYGYGSVRVFNNARDALTEMITTTAAGGRDLAVLAPQQGTVLPPAPENPHGVYFLGEGFVTRANLTREQLDVVEATYGKQVRLQLEPANLQVGAATASVASGSASRQYQPGTSMARELLTAVSSTSETSRLEPQLGEYRKLTFTWDPPNQDSKLDRLWRKIATRQSELNSLGISSAQGLSELLYKCRKKEGEYKGGNIWRFELRSQTGQGWGCDVYVAINPDDNTVADVRAPESRVPSQEHSAFVRNSDAENSLLKEMASNLKRAQTLVASKGLQKEAEKPSRSPSLPFKTGNSKFWNRYGSRFTELGYANASFVLDKILVACEDSLSKQVLRDGMQLVEIQTPVGLRTFLWRIDGNTTNYLTPLKHNHTQADIDEAIHRITNAIPNFLKALSDALTARNAFTQLNGSRVSTISRDDERCQTLREAFDGNDLANDLENGRLIRWVSMQCDDHKDKMPALCTDQGDGITYFQIPVTDSDGTPVLDEHGNPRVAHLLRWVAANEAGLSELRGLIPFKPDESLADALKRMKDLQVRSQRESKKNKKKK